MSNQKLSRRELLKLIAAATGATIISTVPNKWVTPIVEFGALPAHAQGSQRGSVVVTIAERNPDRPRSKKPKSAKTSNIDWTIIVKNNSYSTGKVNVYDPGDVISNLNCETVWRKTISNIPVGTYDVILQSGPDWCSFSDQTLNGQVVTSPGPLNVNFTVNSCCE